VKRQTNTRYKVKHSRRQTAAHGYEDRKNRGKIAFSFLL
jgi:hypothetical protein